MLLEITVPFSPNPSFYRSDLDNTWREGQSRVQTCKILQRVVVCSADCSSRIDPLGYSSLLNSSEEGPQATLCTRQASFSSTPEKNITNECVFIRWNTSGTFGKMQCCVSMMLYFYLPRQTHTRTFSSSFQHFVAHLVTKWSLFSVGKGLSGPIWAISTWAQRARLQVLSPNRALGHLVCRPWNASDA